MQSICEVITLLTKEELRNLTSRYEYLPVSYQFSIDSFNPYKIVESIDSNHQQSMVFSHDDGKSTTVIVEPKKIITVLDNQIVVKEKDDVYQTTQNPIDFLNDYYQHHRTVKTADGFHTGLIGYFGYDFSKYANNHLPKTHDELGLQDIELFEPDITINYQKHEVTLTKLILSDDFNQNFETTKEELKHFATRLKQILAEEVETTEYVDITESFHNQFQQAEFSEKVDAVKRHIYDGDIFQMILSNPYQTKAKGSLINVGKYLEENIYSPYHFYFAHDHFEAVGASPETLIQKTDDKLFSYPLAGTRRRGKTKEEDDFFADELRHSPKEQSEHNMLVDLGRNDVGNISEIGTVKVTKYMELLKFSNVMHLGSKVEGIAKKDITPIDIIAKTLPAGTLSGAPKLSAMQIIRELEQRKRGIYGGGIGYIDFAGDLDLCIGIRLAYKQDDNLVVHAGAGIVTSSDAHQEFHEFENKSRVIMDAIKEVEAQHDFINW